MINITNLRDGFLESVKNIGTTFSTEFDKEKNNQQINQEINNIMLSIPQTTKKTPPTKPKKNQKGGETIQESIQKTINTIIENVTKNYNDIIINIQKSNDTINLDNYIKEFETVLKQATVSIKIIYKNAIEKYYTDIIQKLNSLLEDIRTEQGTILDNDKIYIKNKINELVEKITLYKDFTTIELNDTKKLFDEMKINLKNNEIERKRLADESKSSVPKDNIQTLYLMEKVYFDNAFRNKGSAEENKIIINTIKTQYNELISYLEKKNKNDPKILVINDIYESIINKKIDDILKLDINQYEAIEAIQEILNNIQNKDSLLRRKLIYNYNIKVKSKYGNNAELFGGSKKTTLKKYKIIKKS